jgi:predicted Zn-dependent protease
MSSNFNFTRRNFLPASLGLAGYARGFAEEPRVEIPPYNKLTDRQEVNLGREAAAGIEKEKNLYFVEHSGIHSYVDDMFHKIVKTCRRPNFPYSIKIVDTKEINAFALPGGFVYLNRGLMEWAHSESELAATLSHEVGHVVGRHGANAVSRATTVDSLVIEASNVLFGGDTAGRILEQLGGPVAMLAMLKFSRQQELEADLFGFYNMQRAGWNPNGMVEVFRRFGEQESVLDPLFTIASDHPPASERQTQIVAEMRSFPPRPGLSTDSEGFRRAQTELKKLPPPRMQSKLADR